MMAYTFKKLKISKNWPLYIIKTQIKYCKIPLTGRILNWSDSQRPKLEALTDGNGEGRALPISLKQSFYP